MGSFLSPDFVTDGRNLILTGKAGRGKTHLAVAIAYKAIQNGFEASFTTCAALVEDVARASATGRLQDTLSQYVRPHVLAIDEEGYLAYGESAANALYHVVNERHLRRRSILLTTNKSPKEWGKVLHDGDLADAIVDRLLERGRILRLDGPSMRTRHLPPSEAEVVEEVKDPAIVPGTDRPEFPEPTGAGPPTAARQPYGRGTATARPSGGDNTTAS